MSTEALTASFPAALEAAVRELMLMACGQACMRMPANDAPSCVSGACWQTTGRPRGWPRAMLASTGRQVQGKRCVSARTGIWLAAKARSE